MSTLIVMTHQQQAHYLDDQRPKRYCDRTFMNSNVGSGNVVAVHIAKRMTIQSCKACMVLSAIVQSIASDSHCALKATWSWVAGGCHHQKAVLPVYIIA